MTLRRLKTTTIYRNGKVTLVDGPLVDEKGRVDPADWERYEKQMEEARNNEGNNE